MQKINKITGTSIPLAMNDVDTDMIIPAQYLTSVSREGYGENLFRHLRDTDPDFVLNQQKYEQANILVSQDNFACGSSREHAVWALLGYGIKAVIASSFSDIFYNNSAKNGLLLVQLPENVCNDLIAQSQNGDCQLTIDVDQQTVIAPDASYHFDMEAFRKHCFLHGLDEMDYLLSHKEDIQKFAKSRS